MHFKFNENSNGLHRERKIMSIITLTTDYGLKDHFVGALKGRILTQFPEAQIVDISHHVDLFNIAEASYMVGAAYKSFPAGTVHIIGVDIERNKENKHIVMQWNDHYFICADNGIPGILTQKILPQKVVNINFFTALNPDQSDIDIFITVACHIAKGGLLNVVGTEVEGVKQSIELSATMNENQNTISGCILYVDHFGNLVTNISKELFEHHRKGRRFEIKHNARGTSRNKDHSKPIIEIFNRYSDIAASSSFPITDFSGKKLAVFNEAGLLEIAIFRSNPKTVGSASTLLGLTYRDIVQINFIDEK